MGFDVLSPGYSICTVRVIYKMKAIIEGVNPVEWATDTLSSSLDEFNFAATSGRTRQVRQGEAVLKQHVTFASRTQGAFHGFDTNPHSLLNVDCTTAGILISQDAVWCLW